MTVDIHKIITGNPITKNLMKPIKKRFLINILDQVITF